MEAATSDTGLRNLCIITGKNSVRDQWNEQRNGRRLLDWASQNIDNLARQARATSNLHHQKSTPSKIIQNAQPCSESNNGGDSRSQESEGKESD